MSGLFTSIIKRRDGGKKLAQKAVYDRHQCIHTPNAVRRHLSAASSICSIQHMESFSKKKEKKRDKARLVHTATAERINMSNVYT